MENPFSWDYLTAPLRDTPDFGPLSTAFVVLFAIVFVGSVVAYFFAGRRHDLNPLQRHALHSGSQIMMWITGIGFFFYSFRLMRVTIFNLYMRVWIYLVFLAFVAAIVYFVYYMRRIYPVKLAEYQKRRERRRYTPSRQAAQRSSGRRSRQRGSASRSR